MFFRHANSSDPNSMASRLRKRRIALFLGLIPTGIGRVRILDVGGTDWSWRQLGVRLPDYCEVTLLNLAPEPVPIVPGFVSIQGDARHLHQFHDGEFDLGYSNSVIEHVGTLYDQIAMARELRRVCRGYFVQTPNRYFPLEPHFLVPGWQYLPVGWRRRWLQARDLGWMKRVRDPLIAQAEVEQVRLLTGRELRLLFPSARVYRERIGPFVKSFVMWEPPATPPSSPRPSPGEIPNDPSPDIL
jgi:hypothetical protein